MVVLSKWLRAKRQRGIHSQKLSTWKKLLSNQQGKLRRPRRKRLMKQLGLDFKPFRKKSKALPY